MADVSKIKLPDTSEVNIKDYRIPGVDTTPTSGSDNVVTSGGVYETIVENELVTSAALNDLNDRILDLENTEYVTVSDYDEDQEVVATALVDLNNRLSNVEDIDSIPTENSDKLVSSGGVYEAIEDNSIWEPGTGENSAVLKGSVSTASGRFSVAEGESIASGYCSHAEGSGDILIEQFQVRELTADEKAQCVSVYGKEYKYFGSGDLSLIKGADSYNIYSDNNCENLFYVISKDDVVVTDGEIFDQVNDTTLLGYLLNPTNDIFATDGTYYYLRSFGNLPIASGENSHAEGYATKALGWYSHAEGDNTEALGDDSHAEGLNTKAGWGAHSEGGATFASARYSHTEGYYTTAQNNWEHAQGIYNYCHQDDQTTGIGTIHSIGIGTSNARKNAEEIMNNGDMYLIGVGDYTGSNIKSSNTLQVHVDTTELTSFEFDWIMNDIPDPDFTYIFVDDYLNDHGDTDFASYAEDENMSASELISAISQFIDNPSNTGSSLISGINCYKYTGETFYHNNTNFWLFGYYDYINENWFEGWNGNAYILIETDKTLAGLTAQSLESDTNNETIPYYAILNQDNDIYRLGDDSDDILVAVR